MKEAFLLEIGIPAAKIKRCWWCPAAFRDTIDLLDHQKGSHGYYGAKPRIRRMERVL